MKSVNIFDVSLVLSSVLLYISLPEYLVIDDKSIFCISLEILKFTFCLSNSNVVTGT